MTADIAVDASVDTSSAERYLVPGLVRGILILRMFRDDRLVITAREISEELNIPRSTVFRLAQTLEHLGLLTRAGNEQRFRLGMGVLNLGFELLASLDVSEVGRPMLEDLAAETGMTSHLVVRDGRHVVVVQKQQGRSAFTGGLAIGQRLPAHATVLGRVMLAGLSAEELDQVYADDTLERFSDQTPVDLDDLRRLLETDRQRGYAISDSFFENGISAVAAAVRDRSGAVVAALNVTVAGGFRDEAQREELIVHVRRAASRLSAALDHRPAAVENIRSAAHVG